MATRHEFLSLQRELRVKIENRIPRLISRPAVRALHFPMPPFESPKLAAAADGRLSSFPFLAARFHVVAVHSSSARTWTLLQCSHGHLRSSRLINFREEVCCAYCVSLFIVFNRIICVLFYYRITSRRLAIFIRSHFKKCDIIGIGLVYHGNIDNVCGSLQCLIFREFRKFLRSCFIFYPLRLSYSWKWNGSPLLPLDAQIFRMSDSK